MYGAHKDIRVVIAAFIAYMLGGLVVDRQIGMYSSTAP